MKWKNYGLWISLVSVLYMVIKDLGLQIDLTDWKTYMTVIIGFLAVLGIISNPEKGRGFFDKLPGTPAESTEQTQTQQPSNHQGILPQNQFTQDPSNPLHNQETPEQHQQQYQNMQPDNQYHENLINNEYQGSPNQQNYIQSSQYSPSVIEDNVAQPQEVEPTQVQSEVHDSTTQPTQNNKSFDRSSVHGMPAPPNEHL